VDKKENKSLLATLWTEQHRKISLSYETKIIVIIRTVSLTHKINNHIKCNKWLKKEEKLKSIFMNQSRVATEDVASVDPFKEEPFC